MASGFFSNASNFVQIQPIMIDQPNYYVNSQVNIGNNGRLSPIKQAAPCTSQMFTGQEKYLKALKQHFKPENPNDLSRKYFLLYGMGGIGKTQICLKYVDDTEDLYEYTFWIDTSSDTTVVQSLRDIFKTYLASQTVEFSPAVVLNWISIQKCRWLMIFDNADGSPKIVENFLPSKNKGNILITSRNQELKKIATVEHSMEVTEMSEDTAVLLLLKVSGLSQEFETYESMAKEIVSELYGLPLAIDHAGAFILSGSCEISEFKSIYNKNRLKLMNHEEFCGASKYDKTAYGTWEISFQKIVEKSEDSTKHEKAHVAKYAVNIIKISAFLHHENIPQIMFQRAVENYHVTIGDYSNENMLSLLQNMDQLLFNFNENKEWNYQLFTEAIALLLSYSLIKKHTSAKYHSLHPIIQHWCQDRLSMKERKSWILNTSGLLAASIRYDNTIEEYAYNQKIVVHVINILSHEDELYKHQDYILLEKFANVLDKIAMFTVEVNVVAKILEIRKQIYTEEHPATIISMLNLSRIYRNIGKIKEAEELAVKAVQISTSLLGKEHPDNLKSMANLASIYQYLEKWKEAEDVDASVLEIRTRVLGKQHPDTLRSMVSLTYTYENLGKWEEALSLDLEVLEIRTRVLGKEHPETLDSMENLGCAHAMLGKWKEAEELETLTLEIRSRILGKEHPDTLKSMANLADTYRFLERLNEVEKLEVPVLEIRTRVLGTEHPSTLDSMSNLAHTYSSLGKLKEAEELAVSALEISNRVQGKEHHKTLKIMANLASIYTDSKKLKEAIELKLKVMEIRTRVLGKEHPETIKSMTNAAVTYIQSGRLKEAEKLQLSALEISIKVLGIEHPYTVRIMENLVVTYKSLGEWKEAEELQVPV